MTGSNSNTSGQSIVNATFTARTATQKIPDDVMAEQVSRMVFTIENPDTGPVVQSPTAPEDKTKVWIQTDSVTGIPQGVAMVWSEDQNAWVPSTQDDVPYSPPLEQYFTFDAAAGASTKTASFAEMGNSNYFVDVEVSTFVDAMWQAAPANMNNFGYVITNKTSTSLTFALFAVPTGGLNFLVRIRNRS